MNEDDYNSGPLVVGKAVFEPRVLARVPSDWWNSAYIPCPMPKQQIDVDQINHDYDTRVVHVDKRTHRIRYENETEHEVTVIIEPK